MRPPGMNSYFKNKSNKRLTSLQKKKKKTQQKYIQAGCIHHVRRVVSVVERSRSRSLFGAIHFFMQEGKWRVYWNVISYIIPENDRRGHRPCLRTHNTIACNTKMFILSIDSRSRPRAIVHFHGLKLCNVSYSGNIAIQRNFERKEGSLC